MKFITLVTSLFLPMAAVSAGTFGAVKTYPNFLKPEEIEYFSSVEIIDDFYGIANFDESIAKRIHEVAASELSSDISTCSIDESFEYRRSVPINHMRSTTARHQDVHVNDDGSIGEKVEGKVAFIFLDSNENATFVHGDDTHIPSEAGTLVVFDGHVPHNTIVTGGALSIVGAIDLEKLTFVGPGGPRCSNDSDCPTNDECVCKPVRNLLQDEDELYRRGLSERKRRLAIALFEAHNTADDSGRQLNGKGKIAKGQKKAKSPKSGKSPKGKGSTPTDSEEPSSMPSDEPSSMPSDKPKCPNERGKCLDRIEG